MHLIEIEWIKWIQQIRGPRLDSFFVYWDYVDGFITMTLITLALWLFFCRRLGLDVGLMLLIGYVIAQGLKYLLLLPRPVHLYPELGVVFHSTPGFPSGAAVSGTLIACIVCYYSNHLWQKFVAIMFAVCLCFSRVYLGVHFLSDIFGGVVLGLCLFFLSRLAIKKWERHANV